MSDGPTRRRRTVLAACAAGAAALAGCGDPLSDSGDGGGSPTEDGGSPTGDDDTGGGSANDTGGGSANDSGDGTPDDEEGTGGAAGTTTFRLGGETEGWTGVEPEAIAGETNPTLELRAGTTYEFVWDNLDGEEHELILADEDGEEVEASAASETEGESVSLEFTASEDLAEYFCEYHPESMRGEIEVVAEE